MVILGKLVYIWFGERKTSEVVMWKSEEHNACQIKGNASEVSSYALVSTQKVLVDTNHAGGAGIQNRCDTCSMPFSAMKYACCSHSAGSRHCQHLSTMHLQPWQPWTSSTVQERPRRALSTGPVHSCTPEIHLLDCMKLSSSFFPISQHVQHLDLHFPSPRFLRDAVNGSISSWTPRRSIKKHYTGHILSLWAIKEAFVYA